MVKIPPGVRQPLKVEDGLSAAPTTPPSASRPIPAMVTDRTRELLRRRTVSPMALILTVFLPNNYLLRLASGLPYARAERWRARDRQRTDQPGQRRANRAARIAPACPTPWSHPPPPMKVPTSTPPSPDSTPPS